MTSCLSSMHPSPWEPLKRARIGSSDSNWDGLMRVRLEQRTFTYHSTSLSRLIKEPCDTVPSLGARRNTPKEVGSLLLEYGESVLLIAGDKTHVLLGHCNNSDSNEGQLLCHGRVGHPALGAGMKSLNRVRGFLLNQIECNPHQWP